MFTKFILCAVIVVCVWAVLNKRLRTRTLGTLALSLIAILSMAAVCS